MLPMRKALIPILAAVLMAEAMWVMRRGIEQNSGWHALLQIVVAGGFGLVVYAAVLTALQVPELATVRARLRRRTG